MVKTYLCPNCNSFYRENDKYCPACGQKVIPEKESIVSVMAEWLGTYFINYDSKIPRTFRYLFLPGRLYVDFRKGKRNSYVKPANLLLSLFVSYFLILQYDIGWKNREEATSVKVEAHMTKQPKESSGLSAKDPGTLQFKFDYNFEKLLFDSVLQKLPAITPEVLDSILYVYREVSFRDRLFLKMYKAALMSKEQTLVSYFTDVLQKTYFFFVPLIAVVFYLFYRQTFGSFFYAVIFTIYVICVLLVGMIFMELTGLDIFVLLLLLILIYVYFSFRKITEIVPERWWITLLKTIAVMVLELGIVIPLIVVIIFITTLLVI